MPNKTCTKEEIDQEDFSDTVGSYSSCIAVIKFIQWSRC